MDLSLLLSSSIIIPAGTSWMGELTEVYKEKGEG